MRTELMIFAFQLYRYNMPTEINEEIEITYKFENIFSPKK